MNNQIIVNDKVIGICHGKVLGYFNSQTPNSPFSNFYRPEHGFKVYFLANSDQSTILSADFIPQSHVGTFHSVEQLFAFGKAMTMRDKRLANKIYATDSVNCKVYKSLGRQVSNYNDELWQKVAMQWMSVGMRAKFLQDSFSYNALISTSEYELVEANPYDSVWGAGVSVNQNFEKSAGQNKQGKLLMHVRKVILQQKHSN